jgi:mono/diheme cytochrome c family protein
VAAIPAHHGLIRSGAESEMSLWKWRALKGPGALALCLAASAAFATELGGCPQPRFTGKAPDDYYGRSNPLPDTEANRAAGRATFLGTGGISCATCHGKKGDGKGPLAGQFDPPPRNFTCAQTINGVPDGQLFWIIRYGSPGTSMPPHKKLSDDQIWQVVHFIRGLSK